MPLLLPPSTAATVEDAPIGAVSSIPPLLPSTMTAIVAINDYHCRCHAVNNDNHQKPAVIVCGRQWQRRSSSTEAAADGNHGNGGLC
jgi:hypothetical protein